MTLSAVGVLGYRGHAELSVALGLVLPLVWAAAVALSRRWPGAAVFLEATIVAYEAGLVGRNH
ncbi:hypothetical protein [Streptomyces decoyicus]